MVGFIRIHLAALLCACAVGLIAPRAAAQSSEADKSAARELAKDAADALDKGQFQVAADKFAKADQLFHAPTLVLGLARAYTGLGKYVEAKETYNRIINEKLAANASDQFVQAVEDAKREAAALDVKIGWATINVASPDGALPDGLTATLDDIELKAASFGAKRPLNPGQHELVITAPGMKDVDRRFDVKPREHANIDIKLEHGASSGALKPPPPPGATGTPPPPPPPPPSGDPNGASSSKGSGQRIAGYALIGVGGATLIMGAVTGGLALSKHGALKADCNADGTCDPAKVADIQARIDSYETIGTVSTIGFIAGGVLAATGVVVLLTAPKPDAAPKTGALPRSIAFGPGGATATWQF